MESWRKTATVEKFKQTTLDTHRWSRFSFGCYSGVTPYTLYNTPYNTPYNTLYNTPYNTPYNTLYNIPHNTPYNTLYDTPYNTPYNTRYNTPYNTQHYLFFCWMRFSALCTFCAQENDGDTYRCPLREPNSSDPI